MAKSKQFNQEEALYKAMELFWEKGYASTSLSDLITHLGISKGSFYDTFKSKRAIFDDALDLYRRSAVTSIQSLLDSEPNVKKGMKQLFHITVDSACPDTIRKGCLLINTCTEMAGSDESVKSLLKEHDQVVYDMMCAYLKKGTQKSTKVIKEITSLFITVTTGIYVESKFKKDKKEFLKSIDLILNFLDE